MSFVATLVVLVLVAGCAAIVLPIIAMMRASRAERAAAATEATMHRLEADIARLRLDIARARTDAPLPRDSDIATDAATPSPAHMAQRSSEGDAEAFAQPETPPPAPPLQERVTASGHPTSPSLAGQAQPPLPSEYVAHPGSTADRPPVQTASPRTFEERIGQQWLLYLGLAAVVLGMSYFVKHAFERNWLAPTVRVALGAAAGMALIAGGDRLARRRVPVFGQGLLGGGLALLYLSVFAAMQFYALISPTTAGVAFVSVAALGVVLAERHTSQLLALVALLGASATPWLIAQPSQSAPLLFAYLTLITGAAAWLARLHRWPWLALAVAGSSSAHVVLWLLTRYQRDQYLTLVSFILAAAGASVWLGAHLRRAKEEHADTDTAPRRGLVDNVAILSLHVLMPVGAHVLILGLLAPHTLALLIYFIAVTLVCLVVVDDQRHVWWRVAGWLAVVPPFLLWLSAHPQSRGGLVTLVALYALHLTAELRAHWDAPASPGLAHGFLLHANALALASGLLLVLREAPPGTLAWGFVALAILYAALAFLMRRAHRATEPLYANLAAAFLAAAIGVRFDGPALAMAWTIEGALLAATGLRHARRTTRLGGWLLLGLALASLVDAYDVGTSTSLHAFVNVRFAALLLWVAAAFGLARHYRTHALTDRARRQGVGTGVVLGCIVLLLGLTAELEAWFAVRQWAADAADGPMAAHHQLLAQRVAVSVLWALYAFALIIVGVAQRYRPIRYLAIALLAITALKVFFVDLAELDTALRTFSVLALGVVLLAASYLYQRFLSPPVEDPASDVRREP